MIDYALNYDKIINEICENRAEPELLCNGFCYVKKEVNKKEKSLLKKHTKTQIVEKIIIKEKIDILRTFKGKIIIIKRLRIRAGFRDKKYK